MRIGELAALVGVSTRTVRHYHQRGVLQNRRGGATATAGTACATRSASPAPACSR
ncbi:MerR family transcriptional regulator [Microbispora amethystogenes]|uniref:MerR family transcriptional regulator n=1 Tax=Microbispora amethystogenes TaxID=1427754 RepID=UPI003404178E